MWLLSRKANKKVVVHNTPARSESALASPRSHSEPNPEPVGDPVVLLGEPKLTSDPRRFPAGFESVPDSQIDGGEVDGLWVRAASLRGDEHRHYGEVRQDSFAVWDLTAGRQSPSAVAPEEAALLVCVADGVGSEALSHVGSAMACRLLRQEVLPYASAILDPAGYETQLNDRCTRIVAELANRLKLEAHQRQTTSRALSTTLVAALVGGRTGDGVRRVVYFAVGDSPAYRLRGNTFAPIFGDDGEGLISSSGTDALPNRCGRVTVAEGEIAPGDVMVLCTDGLSNPLRDHGVSQKLAHWWQAPKVPGLPEFYWQLSFRAKSFGDDRTAVCVWMR